MIQSLFLLSPVGEVLIERHFRGVLTSRSVCDAFWEEASVSINHHGGVSATTSLLLNQQLYDSVPPVLEVPESDQGTLYVISILRDGLSYLAVCPAEVSPLLVLEFLGRVHNIFVDYFGSPADESAIKENFSTVYQLLEEMVDYGWPLTTEPNALKAMIRPPTVMSKLLQTASTIVSEELPSGTVSNMPWRAAGVHYSQNEIYMDIVEEVDAIISSNGVMVSWDVSGTIQCQSHLSGIPDLLLTFKEPELIDDCSFHPCVRYSLFEKDQLVSFVPPDGNFELMKYRVRPDRNPNFSPPVFCFPQWSFSSTKTTSNSGLEASDNESILATTSGRLSLQCGVTSHSSLIFSASRKGPLVVEDVAVTIPFPKQMRSTSGFQVSAGNVIFDEAGKVARWNLGKMDASKRVTLSCNFTMATTMSKKRSTDQHWSEEVERISPPNLSLSWKIPLASVSGLSVSGLSIRGETYRPYKGVRNITKSGVFQVRCN